MRCDRPPACDVAGVRSNDDVQAQKAKDSDVSGYSAGSSPAWESMLSYVYVILWIFLSATVILFNKCGPPQAVLAAHSHVACKVFGPTVTCSYLPAQS